MHVIHLLIQSLQEESMSQKVMYKDQILGDMTTLLISDTTDT